MSEAAKSICELQKTVDALHDMPGKEERRRTLEQLFGDLRRLWRLRLRMLSLEGNTIDLERLNVALARADMSRDFVDIFVESREAVLMRQWNAYSRDIKFTTWFCTVFLEGFRSTLSLDSKLCSSIFQSSEEGCAVFQRIACGFLSKISKQDANISADEDLRSLNFQQDTGSKTSRTESWIPWQPCIGKRQVLQQKLLKVHCSRGGARGLHARALRRAFRRLSGSADYAARVSIF